MALNYHHLQYFWLVHREGGLSRAARKLRLSPPTLSTQIKVLEESLGEKLFERRGKRLALTGAGQVAFEFADQIFSLGEELERTLAGASTASTPLLLSVGVLDVVPKMISHRLLLPAQRLARPVRVKVREGQAALLLEQLAAHELDVMISDRRLTHPEGGRRRFFVHELGSFELAVYAAPKLAQTLRSGFPASLHRAPCLLPTEQSALRQDLDRWFGARRIEPTIMAEFDDSALLKAFAHDGTGFVAAARALESELGERYGLVLVGPMREVWESYYAVTADRKLKHPAVQEIIQSAQLG